VKPETTLSATALPHLPRLPSLDRARSAHPAAVPYMVLLAYNTENAEDMIVASRAKKAKGAR
jgi:hypothetical protein